MKAFQAAIYRHLSNRSDSNRCERGATMIEYAILVSLISVAAIAVIAVLGSEIQAELKNVLDTLKTYLN